MRAIDADAGRDGLPGIAHLALGQRRIRTGAVIGELGTGLEDLHPGEILGREDLCSALLRLAHRLEHAVRDLATQEGDVLHARQADVADERAKAEKMAGIFLAQNARADPALRGMLRRARPLSPLFEPWLPAACINWRGDP